MMKCFNNENRSAEIHGLAAICVRRNGVDSMYYVHPDRLGSYTHITDSSRRVIRALHFDPWGNVKSDADWKAFVEDAPVSLTSSFRFSQGFTGHEHYADPYSLTETRFMEGYAEIFAENAETDAETANYADFHALKLALRDNGDVETLRATSLQDGTATINVRNIPAGVYVLRVTDADGKEYHQKIVRK